MRQQRTAWEFHPRPSGRKGVEVMFGTIQIVGLVLAIVVTLTITSDTFAFAVSRMLEAAFDTIEYRLALRARSRAGRLKARRREERRRATHVTATAYSQAG